MSSDAKTTLAEPHPLDAGRTDDPGPVHWCCWCVKYHHSFRRCPPEDYARLQAAIAQSEAVLAQMETADAR